MAGNSLLKQFLEKVILGHIPVPNQDAECTRKAVVTAVLNIMLLCFNTSSSPSHYVQLLLADLLVSRVLAEDLGVTALTPPSSSVMLGSRYKWLDSLIGPIPSGMWCVCWHVTDDYFQYTDSYYSTPDTKELEVCINTSILCSNTMCVCVCVCVCVCGQSLLCSCHINPEVSLCVNSQLDRMGKDTVETLPLRLLTWPHIGKLVEVGVCKDEG